MQGGTVADSLIVLLDEEIAGTLTRVAEGRLRFEYDLAYRERDDATPLSLSMPKQIRTHPDSAVRPWLWGLLPENQRVLQRWAREFHVSASSPFSLLATPVGEDCAGAVQFVPEARLDEVRSGEGQITWLSDAEVAERLRELKQDSTAWLGKAFTGQFSLAGAQAKTALLREDDRWGVPTGAIPTTHILKPAVAGFDDHDLNEHLCLDAARRVGLLAARTAVETFQDETAIVVDRYDRVHIDNRLRRLHQEDLCQALGILPEAKYQNEGGPSPTQIVELFRRSMSSEAAQDTVWRFADALIWNWLIAGTDAHAKNYSLLLRSDEVRLAPLYDIASALPYGRHEKELRLAMKIGDDYRVFPYHNPWPRAARDLGLDEGALLDRVRHLGSVIGDAFSNASQEDTIRRLNRPLPAALTDMVYERAVRCLAVVQRTAPADVAT
jgi:serine/threonine-protein kinase HipA